jgi:hypothetical protein
MTTQGPTIHINLTTIENNLRVAGLSRETLLNYTTELAKHIEHANLRMSRITECERKIREALDAMDERERNPRTISDLVHVLTNPYQKTSLENLLLRSEGYQMYLSKYEKNTSTDRKKTNIEGTFTVLGTIRNGVREEYEIKMYKPDSNPKGSFWCSCPDHKFNSTKKQIVCKHICFLVCKVGKLIDRNFFETKQLTENQFQQFVEKTENIQNLLRDLTISKPNKTITRELFTQHTKPITEEDLCPICYDGFPDPASLLTCPQCTNYVHKECMLVWLERKDTCVYCRSDIWKQYKQLV